MSELGLVLIRAREARGLTLEDAERDTRISRRYLQALEAEQFEVIPAPVYARGFLRSYSSYLGLDPQEVLALFPRDEEASYAPSPNTRAAVAQPPSAVGPARPTWQRPSRNGGPTSQKEVLEFPAEPTIGVDIGVASPANRIKADPAAQARALTVAGAALGAVILVVLVAFLISRLGGGSASTPKVGASTSSQFTPVASVSSPVPSGTSGLPTTRGTVPDVKGQTADTARKAIAEAGYTANEMHKTSPTAKNTVIDQAPAPGIQQDGGTVIIVISDGP
ncbi:MAG TPA: helix-turn-helix domain-containing protein [Tepidiformaceae bacterium]|jgi:transcriptional regulator with XRE-family HTH domain